MSNSTAGFGFYDGYKAGKWDAKQHYEEQLDLLRAKCDFQANILRRLMPNKFPNTYFIHGELGSKDQNGMPEKIMVVPAYGVDFSYIYTREEKTTGPEW